MRVRPVLVPALLLLWVETSLAGVVDEGLRLRFQTSLVTKHYSDKPEHNNNQDLLNVEVELTDHQARQLAIIPTTDDITSRFYDVRWSLGLAGFRNSFGQKTLYAYVGGRYPVITGEAVQVYAKLTAGLMHGYRGEYKDKIPLNQLGVAPSILPAVGVEFQRAHVELVPFGVAGVMLTTGFSF